MARLTRRAALWGGASALVVWGAVKLTARPPGVNTAALLPSGAAVTLNDASGLSETPVFRHLTLTENVGDLLVNRLRGELDEARAPGRPVAISAARHSMGGQAIPRAGHAVTFENGFVEPNTAAGTYRVHAGARWAQVIAALDPLGFSPKVMQANSNFGVAASFCVNAHGAAGLGPVGGTVRSFRMVTHGGEWITCSRTEKPDLFHMTMGGYGLTGMITDLTLDMEQNRRMRPDYAILPGGDLGIALIAAARETAFVMADADLTIERARFLDEGLLTTYRATPDQADLPLVRRGTAAPPFRAPLGQELLKRLQWAYRTKVLPVFKTGATTRNGALSVPAASRDGPRPGRTDILHGYFIPPHRFADFLGLCRRHIPTSDQELLRATVRFVTHDGESWLAYAPAPQLVLMLLFSQDKTQQADAEMARLTQTLIDGVLEMGGSYYLSFRPHATPEQITRAYPRAAEFAAAKRALDPELRFRNALWDRFLAPL